MWPSRCVQPQWAGCGLYTCVGIGHALQPFCPHEQTPGIVLEASLGKMHDSFAVYGPYVIISSPGRAIQFLHHALHAAHHLVTSRAKLTQSNLQSSGMHCFRRTSPCPCRPITVSLLHRLHPKGQRTGPSLNNSLAVAVAAAAACVCRLCCRCMPAVVPLVSCWTLVMV